MTAVLLFVGLLVVAYLFRHMMDGCGLYARYSQRTSERDAATHERDLLGETLGDLLVALGAVNAASMTGPQLVQAAQNVMLHLNKTRPAPARFWPHAPRSTRKTEGGRG